MIEEKEEMASLDFVLEKTEKLLAECKEATKVLYSRVTLLLSFLVPAM